MIKSLKKQSPDLLFLLLLGVFVQLLCAYFSEGFYQGDEHFQVFEFAFAKINPRFVAELPWEYGSQIRSWFLPFVYYGFFTFLKSLGIESPFVWAFAARVLTSAFIFYVAYELHSYFSKKYFQSEFQKRMSLFFLVALFCLPFLRARSSGENLSGALFFWGWIFFDRKKMFTTGFLWSLAFAARFQSGVLILGAFLGEAFVQRKEIFHFLVSLGKWALGFFAGLILCLGLDRWGYGVWVLSFWKYFQVNLLQGEASRHGTSSIWDYLKSYFLVLPPLGAVLLFLYFRGLKIVKNASLQGAIFLFLLIHFSIAHKEMRFLFPLVVMAPVLCVLGIRTYKQSKIKNLLLRFLIMLNSFALFFLALSPAKSEISLYRAVYKEAHEKGNFEYFYLDDDPLRYAGLRPYFYMPFQMEAHKLEKLEDFNSGYLILKGQNLEEGYSKKIIFESNCEKIGADSLWTFRSIPLVAKILSSTKYKHTLLLRCE